MRGKGRLVDLSLHCGVGTPTPTPSLLPGTAGQRGTRLRPDVLFWTQGCDSWVQPVLLGGGKGLVSCPYSGSQNPVGTEETVRYGCWGAWDGPWGPVLFHKSEKPSPGPKGPSSLFPGQPGTKQPFLCSAVWTERDRFDVPGPRWLVIPQPQCKNWPRFLPAEEATAGHPPFVCSGRGNC